MERACMVEGCGERHYARGYCHRHYRRVLATGTPTLERPTGCSVDGCAEPHSCKGFCAVHYRRWHDHGDPLIVHRVYNDDDARLRSRVSTTDPDECWLWTGSINDRGYAMTSVGGRTRTAHRLAYELWVGPIPARLEIDHLCRVRHCINPRHLEPVTHAENIRRAHAVPGVA